MHPFSGAIISIIDRQTGVIIEVYVPCNYWFSVGFMGALCTRLFSFSRSISFSFLGWLIFIFCF